MKSLNLEMKDYRKLWRLRTGLQMKDSALEMKDLALEMKDKAPNE